MNIFDYIVILLSLVTVVLFLVKGFVGSLFSLLSWIGSYVVTSLAFYEVEPLVLQHIRNPTMAKIATGTLLFIPLLLLFTFISSLILGKIKGVRWNILDRFLGLFLGCGVSLFLGTGLFYLIILVSGHFESKDAETTPPKILTDARTYPLFHAFITMAHDILPEKIMSHVKSLENNLAEPLAEQVEQRLLSQAFNSPTWLPPYPDMTMEDFYNVAESLPPHVLLDLMRPYSHNSDTSLQLNDSERTELFENIIEAYNHYTHSSGITSSH